MKRSRFTEEQVIAVLREHEAGTKAGIRLASTGSRKPRCGIEEENPKLKRLLADKMLEASALRELLSKKW
jgi:putative transposase